MNFFEAQAKAKSQTTKLVLLFSLAVLLLILLTNLFIMLVFGFLNLEEQVITVEHLMKQFNWKVFTVVAVSVSLIILIGSLVKISSLSGGGKVVAKALGGERVTHDNDNLQYRVLLNVVEEMAIASGTPVPPVYVLKNESGINAFAAGFTLNDAVIGITQGALDYFDRSELQAVIAHEFSHIVHGDMRLNMRLVGVLHGILMIGIIGSELLDSTHYRSRSNKGQGQLFLLGLGLVVLGYSGTFFGNMIKAGVSRQREYLADAAAVQFTRDNQGIANALRKIGGYSQQSYLKTANAATMSHAYFSNGIQSKVQSIFATHPPLNKRIKAVDPSWDESFANVDATPKGALTEGLSASFFSDSAPAPAQNLVDSVGQLETANIAIARDTIAGIPSLIKDNLYSYHGAQAAVIGMLLAKPNAHVIYKKQMDYLQANVSKELIAKLHLMTIDLQELPIKLRLPILEIALPYLRSSSLLEYQTFMDTINWLIRADDKVDIFEWCIERIIGHYLKIEFEKADYKIHTISSLQRVKHELEVVLTILCKHFVEAKDQLTVTMNAKSIVGIADLELLPEAQVSMAQFSKAVDKLALLNPRLKRKVIDFCYFIVTQDNDYSIEEQETLRALAESLDCPIPIR